MFSLMTPRRERAGLARREPLSFFPPELASLFEFPRWVSLPPWEWEPWGFETEELENEIVLRAEVAGFEPSELEVTMRGNELTVRAEHTEPEGEAKERRHARLVRTMTLPAGIEPQKVEARYHNGVLEGMCLALRQSSRGTLKSRPEVGGCRRSSVSLDGTTSSRKPKPRLPGL